jgi:4-carboxymuconolactone decarboxylase
VTPRKSELDDATLVLVQLSAAIAASDEATVRYWLTPAAHDVPPVHVEELLLQSYLFCGFPRALNAAREWRRVSQRTAPTSDESDDLLGEEWRERGEQTCAAVYGAMYDKLRLNVRDLHPALDAIDELVSPPRMQSARLLLARILGK